MAFEISQMLSELLNPKKRKKGSKRRKLTIFILCVAMIFTSSVTVFGETKVLTNTEKEVSREQPPENWQYAGEIMYNKGVVMVSYNGIMGALGGIIFGPASLGSIAKGILAGLGSYGLHHGDDFHMYVKKIGFYKQSTDNSGFPYYCHDILYYYLKDSNGNLKYLYNHDDYYHSYTPQNYY